MLNNSYISIDLETSGLQPKHDRIIEVGACRVIDNQIQDTFHTLINPHLEIPTRITELTGISTAMLEEAPEITAIIHSLVDFCGDLPLLGHHIIFDYSFLKRITVTADIPFEKQGIDTLKICRELMPETEKKNLDSACRYYQIERQQSHRALDDAHDTHLLYQQLKSQPESLAESNQELFAAKPLIYKVKREQPATKKQKQHLRDLLKYHKIDLTVQIDYLSRNEISRITDKIISQYGRIL